MPLPTQKVVLVDSGGANIRSIGYALERLGCPYLFTSDWQQISSASHVLLPGVGHVGRAMQTLQQSGLDRLIPQLRQPVLGICVGMQLLFQRSQESELDLLGVFAGQLQQLPQKQIVPHMGWNTCRLHSACSTLLAGVNESDWFYFVHSYCAPVGDYTLASCHYGVDFTAVVAQGNFYGCQFHPERSGAAGARMLANFLALPSDGRASGEKA